MSKKTHPNTEHLLIRHLYGEQVSETSLQELLQDPECRHQYEALNGVTQELQNSSSARRMPAPEDTVSRVFAAARSRRSRFAGRPVRLVVLGGVGAVAASILLVLLFPATQQETEPTTHTLELQWDDTPSRIQTQQTLNVMQLRTAPDLWDESAVMTLDSLAKTTLPGVEIVGTNPRK